MKYIFITFFLFLSFYSRSQSNTETIRMSVGFNPPVSKEVLDKLKQDTTTAWIRFIRANYCLYLNNKEIDAEELQRLLRIDDRIKLSVDIERQKPLIVF